MDQPIRSRVASKEYRKNWDLVFRPRQPSAWYCRQCRWQHFTADGKAPKRCGSGYNHDRGFSKESVDEFTCLACGTSLATKEKGVFTFDCPKCSHG